MDDGREQLAPGDPPVVPQSVDRAMIVAAYRTHRGSLRRFLLGIVRDDDLAGDLLQATFVKALEQGHTARIETLKAWLFRVALNEALVVRRRNATHDRALESLGTTSHVAMRPPDDSLVRAETVARVREVIERLPADQRLVVRARMYDDKTFAEIARDLGIPLGTVLTRMRRALQKLRAALRAEE